jgi:hypothetical protein
MDLRKEAGRPNKGFGNEKIGEFLVRVNAMSPKHVQKIIQKQKKSPQKFFGEIALEKGFVLDDITKKYLASRGFI